MQQMLDASYGCSGVCKSATFPFSQNLTEGVPTEICAQNIQIEMDQNGPTIVGMLWLATVVTFASWVAQFFLWCKHKKEAIELSVIVKKD